LDIFWRDFEIPVEIVLEIIWLSNITHVIGETPAFPENGLQPVNCLGLTRRNSTIYLVNSDSVFFQTLDLFIDLLLDFVQSLTGTRDRVNLKLTADLVRSVRCEDLLRKFFSVN